eukprot:m.170267 g.170267  ORF g.170267 m.170267 type:complete len:154 (-) comp16485_c0_seq20:1494-1955(-)
MHRQRPAAAPLPDIRWALQRALSSHMRFLLSATYSKDKGLALLKILTQLSLLSTKWTIRKPQDLKCLPGVGSAWVEAAKTALKRKQSKGGDYFQPPSSDKPFVLSAPAFLVALLTAEQDGLAGMEGNFLIEGSCASNVSATWLCGYVTVRSRW